MTGFLGRQHTAATKARISGSLKGRPHPHRDRPGHYSPAVIAKLAAHNTVQWTPEMDAVLRDGIARGSGIALLAAEIGVAEGTARKRADALELRRPCRRS